MSRVMILGAGPLPRPGMSMVSAPSLRTRQLLKPVLEAGHTVYLFTLPLAGAEGPEGKVAAMMPDNYEGLTYQRLTNQNGEFALRALGEQVRQLKPDALVAVNTYPAFIGARLPVSIPFWADLNGYWMAEAQGRCWIRQDDAELAEAWVIERAIVRRVDKFSAVSRPQLHAMLGELAGVGRLNRHTFEYPFGHHIPNAGFRWVEVDPQAGKRYPQPLLRGPIVPTDAFVIVWCGGFQAWADVASLVGALNLLMARYASIHFVSLGGRIEGEESRVFQQFEELVEQSPHKDRFHHLGWLEPDRLARAYHESDLGINVDARNYETMFGARNRLGAMASEGLAIVTTIGTEISEWLEDGHGALAAPLGDPKALAEAIEPWIEQREELEVYAGNARRMMEREFTYAKTTQPLLKWLKTPRLAPDNQVKVEKNEGKMTDLSSMALNPLEEEAMLLERHGIKHLQRALADFEAGHAKTRRRFMFGMR